MNNGEFFPQYPGMIEIVENEQVIIERVAKRRFRDCGELGPVGGRNGGQHEFRGFLPGYRFESSNGIVRGDFLDVWSVLRYRY